jgi:hypothetical protein
MSMSCRIFFVEEDDRVRSISYARFRRFYFLDDKNEKFPEYAGKRLRYAFIIIDLEERKPLSIRRSDFSTIQFDSEGRLDKADRLRGAALAMNSSPRVYSKPAMPSVIDANYRFSGKRYAQEFRWTPSAEVMNQIEVSIFKNTTPLKLV